MEDPMTGHYEENFKFPLLKLIRKIADEKDISYADAADLAIPEYEKQIRYRDKEYTDGVIAKRQKELVEEGERERKELEAKGKGGH